MRRSKLSEKDLVVVLFVIVVVIFSFAQADTNKIEKMYFDSGTDVTITPAPVEHSETYSENKKGNAIIPVTQLR